MHPILFKIRLPLIGDFALHTFGVMVAIGSFLAILSIRREGTRRGFDPELLMGIAVETLLVGVLGSRLLFILVTPQAFAGESFWAYLNIRRGGLVWYGGLISAGFWAVWRARNLKLPWRTVVDIMAPAGMLGLAVGRIGCLMAGDDHGKISPDGPHWWTLTFKELLGPDGQPLPEDEQPLMPREFRGQPLYPSQPHMGIGAFAIFLLLQPFRKPLASRPGSLTLLMLSLYAVHRFFVELTRGDAVRGYWEVPVLGQRSTSQVIGIPIFAAALGLFLMKVLRPPTGAETAPPPEPEPGKPAG